MKLTEPRRLLGFRTPGRFTNVTFNSVACSPDGKQIAFSFESRQGSAIGTMVLESGSVTKLAGSGVKKSGRPRYATFWDLQFTPDSKHLLYAFSEDDGERHSIRLLEIATKEQRCLIETDVNNIMRPVLSPNGQHILFELWDEGTSNLCQISVMGGERAVLTHTRSPEPREEYRYLPGNIYPAYSPDGTRIAFVSSDYNEKVDNPLQICTMRSDGTGLTRLTDFPDHCAQPIFHPDGEQIVFTNHAELGSGIERKKWTYRLNLCLVNVDGSDARRLEESDSVNFLGGISPDGRYIVYQSSGEERFEEGKRNWDIRLLDMGTGIVHKVTDDDFYDCRPLFDPDGKSIIFVSERDDFMGIYQTAIMRVDWSARTG